MDEIIIRAAVHKDLPAIVRLLAADEVAGSRESLTDPIAESYVAAFEAISADPNHGLFVADKEGEIMGTFQLSFIPNMTYQGGWRAQIEGVMVSTNLRNQGIGTAMIRWAIARARERDCLLVQLTSFNERTKAHQFYGKLGFVFSHQGAKLDLRE
ncbi:MAG: GNAT family N-acetyltransferase [Thermodesulfobacteriota bacterium]